MGNVLAYRTVLLSTEYGTTNASLAYRTVLLLLGVVREYANDVRLLVRNMSVLTLMTKKLLTLMRFRYYSV